MDPQFFFFFWLHCVACGILVPRPGVEPMPSAVKSLSPNHWTSREFPMDLQLTKEWIFLFCLWSVQYHLHPSPGVLSDFHGQSWELHVPKSFLHVVFDKVTQWEVLRQGLEDRREKPSFSGGNYRCQVHHNFLSNFLREFRLAP